LKKNIKQYLSIYQQTKQFKSKEISDSIKNMNLLIFNMEMNEKSKVLSHCIDWVNNISIYFDKVFVITVKSSNFKVNENVKVFSIKRDKFNRLSSIILLYKILFKIHKNYKINGYFVHMAAYFVPFIFLFKLYYKIPILFWYAHSSVTKALKIATLLSDKIFSPSKESFKYKTSKIEFTGHGINTDFFKFIKNKKCNYSKFAVFGRISETKNIHKMIEVFNKIENKNINLTIIGEPLIEIDKKYFDKIFNFNYKNIFYSKNIPKKYIFETYKKFDVIINLSDTGSLDKVIIEPMAMGIPVITSNKSAIELFSHLDGKGVFLTTKQDFENDIKNLILTKPFINRNLLRKEIEENHSIKKLAKKISDYFIIEPSD